MPTFELTFRIGVPEGSDRPLVSYARTTLTREAKVMLPRLAAHTSGYRLVCNQIEARSSGVVYKAAIEFPTSASAMMFRLSWEFTDQPRNGPGMGLRGYHVA